MKRTLYAALAGLIAATSAYGDVQLHPFTTDKPVRSDGDRWSYFLQLPQGVKPTGDGVLRIDYDTSPTLLSVQQSLSALLNGQPIGSLTINNGAVADAHWDIHLPARYFKNGFNEISIITRSRSRIGPCLEDDDMRNWIRFHATSLLRLDVGDASPNLLNAYPYPFVNWLEEPVTATPISVGPGAKDSSISAALNIAAGWGQRITNSPLALKLTRSSVNGTSVHVGLPGEFGDLKQHPDIEIRNSDLWVTGGDAGVLDASVRSLNDPQISSQMTGSSATAIAYTPKESDAAPRLGTTTFEELGYPSLRLAGVGSQGFAIILRRPLSVKVGRGGKLKIRFRHSAALLKTRSILSIAINGQEVGSMALTPDNANEGELICPLPINLADSNQWTIGITSHNELDNVDCAKAYQDIAWTTILGTSEFELQDGTLPNAPFLEGFPYLRNSEGFLPEKVRVNLGLKPSTEVMSCAATTVARAAQTNRGISTWEASTADLTGTEDLIVGTLRQENRFQSIRNQLLVAPSKNGDPTVNALLPILPSSLIGGVVIQAIPKPSGRGVTYVVLGDSNEALARFNSFLATSEAGGLIKGQVSVFTKEGEVFAFDMMSPSDRRAAEAAEMRRYKPGMTLIMTTVLVLFTALAGFIGKKFVKKKPVAQ